MGGALFIPNKEDANTKAEFLVWSWPARAMRDIGQKQGGHVMSKPEFFNPPSVHAPLALYSHGGLVKAGSDILYVAGQVGTRPDGTLATTIGEQADEAFANIIRVLQSKGMTAANIVKLNIYAVMGQTGVEQVRAARHRHLGDHRPTSTFVYIAQLVDPKYLIEIEAIAAR
jgi:enamine deaminase RidA (YjgF/YER057c/UK114 family)